jgi:hypothetical protein
MLILPFERVDICFGVICLLNLILMECSLYVLMAIDAKLPTLCVNKYLGDQFVFNETCLDIGFKFNFLVSA